MPGDGYLPGLHRMLELTVASLGYTQAPAVGLNQPDHIRIVNEVVRGNLDVALKLLATKPDKDLEARAKKMQAECEKTLKMFGP